MESDLAWLKKIHTHTQNKQPFNIKLLVTNEKNNQKMQWKTTL